jgi:hypothetical protein
MSNNSSKKSKSRSNTPAKKGTANKNNNTEGTQTLSPKTEQAFNDALEDVHTRFILNLPIEELSSSNRIFFQLEQG